MFLFFLYHRATSPRGLFPCITLVPILGGGLGLNKGHRDNASGFVVPSLLWDPVPCCKVAGMGCRSRGVTWKGEDQRGCSWGAELFPECSLCAACLAKVNHLALPSTARTGETWLSFVIRHCETLGLFAHGYITSSLPDSRA